MAIHKKAQRTAILAVLYPDEAPLNMLKEFMKLTHNKVEVILPVQNEGNCDRDDGRTAVQENCSWTVTNCVGQESA